VTKEEASSLLFVGLEKPRRNGNANTPTAFPWFGVNCGFYFRRVVPQQCSVMACNHPFTGKKKKQYYFITFSLHAFT